MVAQVADQRGDRAFVEGVVELRRGHLLGVDAAQGLEACAQGRGEGVQAAAEVPCPAEFLFNAGDDGGETLRAIGRASAKTQVITNTATLPPFTVGIGKGSYPEVDEIKRVLRAKTAGLVAIDAMALARKAGSPMSVNIVLLGALIQTGALGFSKESVKEAIKRRIKPALVEMNLNAFDLGFEAAAAADSAV